MFRSLADLALHLDLEVEDADPEAIEEQINEYLMENEQSEFGTWICYHDDPDNLHITIEAIIGDMECMPIALYFPFHWSAFESAWQEMEDTARELYYEMRDSGMLDDEC